jgi:hypothetical protein
MGKMLFWLGLAIASVGLLLYLMDKIGFHPGHLPGDFSWKGENSSFYFPLTTSIILSILLTLLLNAVLWIFRK